MDGAFDDPTYLSLVLAFCISMIMIMATALVVFICCGKNKEATPPPIPEAPPVADAPAEGGDKAAKSVTGSAKGDSDKKAASIAKGDDKKTASVAAKGEDKKAASIAKGDDKKTASAAPPKGAPIKGKIDMDTVPRQDGKLRTIDPAMQASKMN